MLKVGRINPHDLKWVNFVFVLKALSIIREIRDVPRTICVREAFKKK